MELNSSDHYAPPPLAPPHSSSAMSYFAHQALRVGYMHPDQVQPGDFSPHPNNVPGSFLREIEKQKIREEIIAAEMRRRQLEAEVRREMLMEREIALGDTHGFPLFSGPQNMVMNSRLPILNHSQTRYMDALPILNHSENKFKDALPFSRDSEVRISEVKATPEVNKERFILLPKPEENVSGIKRKDMTPPETSETVHLSDPVKKTLHCELCQVSATSEGALKEHFQGKKHKSREARQFTQISGQNFAIGLFSRKAINSPKKLEDITKDIEEEPKEEISQVAKQTQDDMALQVNKNSEVIENDEVAATETVELKQEILEVAKQTHGDMALQVNKNSKVIKKYEGATTKKVNKDGFKKFKFWCPMCKIGAFAENVMNAHMRGKKHTSLLLESLNSRLAAASENKNVSEITSEKESNRREI